MTNKHELGKAKRRQHIITIARRILNDEGLSMRQLSAEANISISTIYNLFGSKHGILEFLMETDAEAFKSLTVSHPAEDALERIYNTLTLATDALNEQDIFYKGLFSSAMNVENRSINPFFIEQRTVIWSDLLKECIAQKIIHDHASPDAIALIIVNLYSGLLQEWVLENMTAEDIHNITGYSISLMLLGTSKKPFSQRIKAQAEFFKQRINETEGL